MCVYVLIVSERVWDVDPQVLAVLGEDEKSSFHFYGWCLFSLGIFFVITCDSLFLTLFFLEVQGGVGGFSER